MLPDSGHVQEMEVQQLNRRNRRRGRMEVEPIYTSADAVAHLRRAIADESVAVEVVDVTEPSPVSPTDDDRWGALEHLVAQVFPDAVATPYVQNGATDSRRFATWCEHVYRFAPLRMSDADRARLHAANESVSVVTLAEGVDFMTRLIEEVAG